jgi:hypothetical protein
MRWARLVIVCYAARCISSGFDTINGRGTCCAGLKVTPNRALGYNDAVCLSTRETDRTV